MDGAEKPELIRLVPHDAGVENKLLSISIGLIAVDTGATTADCVAQLSITAGCTRVEQVSAGSITAGWTSVLLQLPHCALAGIARAKVSAIAGSAKYFIVFNM